MITLINPYSIPTFATSFIVIWLGFTVYAKNRNSPVNRSLFLMCSSTAIWLFFASMAYNCKSIEPANILMRVSYLGVVNIAVTMVQFVAMFLNIDRLKKNLKFLYIYSFFICALIFYSNYLIKGVKQYFWGYYPIAGKYHPIFLAIFIGLITICIFLLIFSYFKKDTSSIRKKQIKYVLFAIFIFDFSSVDFIANYGISFYPFGYVTTTLLILVFTYSIVRYRLLDVTNLITRTGIFVATYSLVLGIPFVIAFGWQKKLIGLLGDSWWLVPLVSSTILATTGPFIYLYIQKRAEDQIMHEQRRYQNTLRHASAGMGGIKDLKKLLNFIVQIINQAVQLEHCLVYLYNSFNKNFVLGAYRRKRGELRTIGYLEGSSPLVDYLIKHREPLVYEEIKQKAQDFSDAQLARVELVMKDLDAAVAVPSFIEDRLMAIIMLGKKRSEKLFSESDLAVFTIVANQAALAIENAQFFEDMNKTHEQLFRAEKMATIGTMADGLSHQINNRLHALGFIAGDVMDSIKLKRGLPMPMEIQQLLSDIEFGLQRVQDNVKQGGEIVQGLLKYTRKDESGMGAVDFDQLIKSSIEMAQYKVKINQLKIIKDYPLDLPKIKGNFTQLQEVFFNLIDNANDAMMQRKTEKKEPDYVPQFQITAGVESDHLQIQVIDNGIGVKKEDREKLFTPFFTTKLSSKKGTGLGLYVLQKIIEDNHNGQVSFFSEYMKETRFVIQLPIVV